MLQLHRDVKWCWPQAWTSFVHRPVMRACPWADLMLQRASSGVLGALGCLLEACPDVQEALGQPLGMLESSWRCPGADESCPGGLEEPLSRQKYCSGDLQEPLSRQTLCPGGLQDALDQQNKLVLSACRMFRKGVIASDGNPAR